MRAGGLVGVSAVRRRIAQVEAGYGAPAQCAAGEPGDVAISAVLPLGRRLGSAASHPAASHPTDGHPADAASWTLASLAPEQAARLRERCALDGSATVGRVGLEPGLPLAGMKARLACEKLAHAAELLWCDPPLERIGELDDLAAFTFAVVAAPSEAALQNALRLAGVLHVRLMHVDSDRLAAGEAAPPVSAAPPPAGQETGPAAKPVETMRVEMERLDQLMNLSGQLAIARGLLANRGRP